MPEAGTSGYDLPPMPRTALDSKRRLSARVALYGSVLLVSAVAAGLVALLDRPLEPLKSEGWIAVDYLNLPVVKLFQRYVQIDTSATTGDEVAGARFLAAQLAAAGIPAHVEQLDGRHANLWAILPGESPEAIVLHNHIDVTPIENRADWFAPPFGGQIELPWIYGRGVFDMKSVAMAQLQALIALKKSGVKLKRSVIYLGTGGEEYGSDLGTQWILSQHPELVRRFWAVLTEGGVVEARSREEIKYWGTEFGQRRYVDLVFCSSDKSRLDLLQEDLRAAAHPSTGLQLTPEVASFLKAYVPTRDSEELRRKLLDPEALLDDPKTFRTLPDYLQSMFRNEAVPFSFKQVEGGGWELDVKLQLLPGVELADAREQLLPEWMTFGLPVVVREPATARHGSPLDHPAFKIIQETLKDHYPDATIGPYFLPWTATDARFFRAAGIPAYGFSPFLIMATDTYQVDAPNERMALPGFVGGVDLYTDLLSRLAADK